MNKLKCVAIGLALTISQFSNAASILITQFDNADGGNAPNAYTQMQSNLASFGHSVDIVDARTGGNLANALSNKSYDQVFLWDLTSSTFLNSIDVSSLGSFWNQRRGLVVDTRSYGHYFQGDNTSEVALLGNIATNLQLAGGGVWIGTDHDPQWTNNGNLFLDEIGVNTVTGSFGDPVNFADPSSVLLSGVTASDLWGAGQTVGRAPVGIQPNGLDMFLHFGSVLGSDVLPYISASFDLLGVDPDPQPVNAPSILSIFVLAMAYLNRKTILRVNT